MTPATSDNIGEMAGSRKLLAFSEATGEYQVVESREIWANGNMNSKWSHFETLVAPAPVKSALKVGGHDVAIQLGSVKVGCQTVTNAQVRAVAGALR